MGASWAAVYGVAQNWTRLKRLSSSRSNLRQGPNSNSVRAERGKETAEERFEASRAHFCEV